MSNRGSTLTTAEAETFRDFVAYASTNWAATQTELAKLAQVSQSMLAKIISRSKSAGGKTVRAIADATAVSIDDILNGSGIEILRRRGVNGISSEQARARGIAAEALAKLYSIPLLEAHTIMDEVGIHLPGVVSPQSWFDVGRAALERKRAGVSL